MVGEMEMPSSFRLRLYITLHAGLLLQRRENWRLHGYYCWDYAASPHLDIAAALALFLANWIVKPCLKQRCHCHLNFYMVIPLFPPQLFLYCLRCEQRLSNMLENVHLLRHHL